MFVRLLFSILITLFFLATEAQQWPTGYPYRYSKGWAREGWLQADSGFINASRDTTVRPKFPGTQIFWQRPGVDSIVWIWDGKRYKPLGGSSGGITVESDPTVPAWVKTISTTNISNWNSAYDNKIDSLNFNISNGVLTAIKTNAPPEIVDLDGRYLLISDTAGLGGGGFVKTVYSADDTVRTGQEDGYRIVELGTNNLVFKDSHSILWLNNSQLYSRITDMMNDNLVSTVHFNTGNNILLYENGSVLINKIEQNILGTDVYVNGTGLKITPTAIKIDRLTGSGTVPLDIQSDGTLARGQKFDSTSLSNRINTKQDYTDTTTYDATKYWTTQNFLSLSSPSITNWNTAYDKRVTGASFAGTTTKTLTLTYGDASTLSTATFTDNNDVTTTDNYLTTSGNAVNTRKAFQSLTDGSTVTINCAAGPSGKVTIAGNRTLAVSNVQNGDIIIIIVTQDATGGRSFNSYPANSIFPGGSLTYTTTGGAKDMLIGVYDGVNYSWGLVKDLK